MWYLPKSWRLSVGTESFNIFQPKPPRSRLWIAPGVQIDHPAPRPNFFWRWMQYIFFGFRWENV
jgi:hypothetical protein